MGSKIFYTLIVITCLNSTNISKSDEITHHGSGRCWISVTGGGLSLGSILGIIEYFEDSRRNGLLSSIANITVSCTYWYNRRIGLIGRFDLFGDHYMSFKNDRAASSIIQVGMGIKYSYNGQGGNNRIKKTYYGGGLIISGMWGSIIEVFFDRAYNTLTMKPKRVGFNVKIIPIEMIMQSGFTCGIDLLNLDLKSFLECHENGISNTVLLNIRISFGKTWWM